MSGVGTANAIDLDRLEEMHRDAGPTWLPALIAEARQARALREAAKRFARCPFFGHEDDTTRRRVDCADDQCVNPDHVRWVDCSHPSHALRVALRVDT